MRMLFVSTAVGLILASTGAQAMMAPKFERARALGAAIEHMWEIASILPGPIEKIEYVGGGFRFSAGRCFVPVSVRYQSAPDGSHVAVTGAGAWNASVGKMQCQ
jgi:pyruvoyl-dependent arginine decarboxylase (PvlArgDC)